MKRNARIVIVGAGPGGLTVGIILARRGMDVTIVEKRDRVGGYVNLYLVGGDTHPGSGLPTIYDSGRISANLICEQRGIGFERADFTPDVLR